MLFVASSNQSGSASKAINSIELKNFTALGLGLPKARSFPALTRNGTQEETRPAEIRTLPKKKSVLDAKDALDSKTSQITEWSRGRSLRY